MRLVFAFILITCWLVLGDTLELKDGRLLDGTYLGGSQSTVRFRAKDKTLVVSVADVLALTFDRKADAGTATTEPASAAATEPAAASETGTTVMAGTTLTIRTKDPIDSKRQKSGHRFTGQLEFDLLVGKTLVAKKGTLVYGVLTEVKNGGRFAKKTELHLALTDIAINNQRQPIQTGGFALRGEKQGTGKKVAVGAGIGRLARGNSKGARRGAAVGLTAAALTSKQIQVPPGTLLDFQLKAPFTVK